LIQELALRYPVQKLCQVLRVARSSSYYRPVSNDDLSVLVWIEEVLLEFPRYGYRRVTVELGRRRHAINHKRVQRIMQEHDLIQNWHKRIRTTDSQHGYGSHPNLLKELTVERPDQVWCSDITYVRLPHGFVYLAIVLDVFTRCIRGWHLGQQLDGHLAMTALERALAYSAPEIHHSDQGVQYAATGYVERLREAGIAPSMAAKGRPTDNPYVERVMRTIKEEEVSLNEYADIAQARANLGHFIDVVYQTKRIHSALGYLTPAEFETQWRELSQQGQLPLVASV
jgi:transposase InsO family protein